MTDPFPREYDRDHYARLRQLYGDRLPPIERILVRQGLHGLVDKLFAELGKLPAHRDTLRVLRIETRGAGLLEVVTTGAALGAGDILENVEGAARAICEHCGEAARMTAKVDVVAPMVRGDLEPVGRLLCVSCENGFLVMNSEVRT